MRGCSDGLMDFAIKYIEYYVLTSLHVTVPRLDFEPIIECRCVALRYDVCSSSAIRSSYQVVVQSRESVM